jgi:hypothetical protein
LLLRNLAIRVRIAQVWMPVHRTALIQHIARSEILTSVYAQGAYQHEASYTLIGGGVDEDPRWDDGAREERRHRSNQ